VEEAGVTDPSTDDLWTPMVNVTVNNPPPPIITHPEDITFNEGDPDMRISWTATSEDEDYYEIYKNGSFVSIGLWTSPTPIFHPISHLLIGDYEFTIVVYDDFNQSTNDTVIVHVRDLAAPIISSPADITFDISEMGHYVEWTAIDLHPVSFELMRDGIAIDFGPWDENTLLRFSLDNLILGKYNYCLILTDESNNVASDCVIVNVIETTRNGSPSLIISILSIFILISISSLRRKNKK